MPSSRHQFIQAQVKYLIRHLDLSLFDKKKIFITGGTGFFGLWLLAALKVIREEAIDIQATVLSRNPEKFLQHQPEWRGLHWLKFERGDVKDFNLAPLKYDFLIHAATDTSREAHSDPLTIFADIVMGTKRVLNYAVDCGVQAALCVSSGAVYGSQPPEISRIPDDAAFACLTSDSNSAYGEGKRVMEFLASTYAKKFNIRSVCARCFAFVGAGLPLDQHFAIGNFIRDAIYRDYIEIRGNGIAVRSYLYGADLAVWLLKLLATGQTATTYNVGSDKYLSIIQLAETVRRILAPEKEIRVTYDQNIEQSSRSVYVPSIDRARQLGLDVWTDLDDAILKSADYIKLH